MRTALVRRDTSAHFSGRRTYALKFVKLPFAGPTLRKIDAEARRRGVSRVQLMNEIVAAAAAEYPESEQASDSE